MQFSSLQFFAYRNVLYVEGKMKFVVTRNTCICLALCNDKIAESVSEIAQENFTLILYNK
jgi:hypothetical protein